MINWRHILDDAFRVMAEVAPDLLQTRLQQHLAPGQRWPDILIALDQEHHTVDRRRYRERDPAVQLRMVTERLGRLGYPFDDTTRETSARGQMLRITRNGFAHWEDLTPFEVLRVFDDIAHLLARLGDDQARNRLDQLRQSNGLSAYLFEPPAAPRPSEDAPDSDASQLTEQELHLTARAARIRRDSASGGTPELVEALGTERQRYQPYRVVRQGNPEDLASRLGPRRAEKVRAVIENVVDSQWPVMKDGVIQDTVRSFGRPRTTSSPRKKIEHLIHKMASEGQLYVSQDGAVWPSQEAEQGWHGFRPDPDKERKAEEIPAREIRNASQALRDADSSGAKFDFVKLTAAEFGFKRVSPQTRAHFGAALEGAQSR